MNVIKKIVSNRKETKFECIAHEHYPVRDLYSFNLSVENCRITEVRILYRIIADQLKVETEIIERAEKEGQGDVHPLQYGVREFLENILTEMKKVEGIDNLGYYVIKAR